MPDPYREALNSLVGLGADRVLVLQGPAPMQARLSHGFDQTSNWSDQISLGVLERSLQGEPLLLADVSQSSLANRWSVQISGICSVVCVPFWSPSSRILGLLYADTRTMQRAFSRETISAMQACARRLEQALYGGNFKPLEKAAPIAQEQPGIRLGLKRPPTPSAPPPPPLRGKQPAPRSLAVFLRCLATMVAAGLPLERALSVLGMHQGDSALEQACGRIHQSLCAGSQLSSAMRQQRIFPPFECTLVEVGERTGSLHEVLAQLATLGEKRLESQLRLQNSLVYPALLSLFSLAAVFLAPPLVLRGQFELIRQSGQKPPWLTQLLMTLSEAIFSPLGLVLAGVLALLLAGLVRELRRRPSWREKAWQRLFRTPVLGRLILHSGCARFARALAITYRVGLAVPQGLELASRASALPHQARDLPLCLAALNEGQSMSRTLAQMACLPRGLIQLVAAGEECGKLDSTLEWVARFYEAEFETNLDCLLSLLQPLLILVMGLLVGCLLLATLLPMVNLVQQL